MAAKRQRSAPQAAPEPPAKITRGRPRANAKCSAEDAVDPVQDQLSFLGADEFDETVHIPALYRLSHFNSHPVQPVRGKNDTSGARSGNDVVAEYIGFPSPFLAVNLGDRQGIWQSDAPLMRKLGEDPRKQCREVLELHDGRKKAVAPAGLTNLGATCYLNSLLQYLFFNADFRQNLLDVTSTSEVVKALQQVFACMAKSKRNVVDPSLFVQAAGVSIDEQEDATEFSTLLLDWLERELNQGESGAKGGAFIPALFQGEITQILTCLENQDHTFERPEPFFELRARLTPESGTVVAAPAEQAKAAKGVGKTRKESTALIEDTVVDAGDGGLPSAAPLVAPKVVAAKKNTGGKRKAVAPPPVVRLEELLRETTFPDESLDGSNQYHCPKCDRKVDAKKSLRMARPPQYLHVIVERYHYDLQKGERKKLNNPVSFPQHLKLRLRQRMADGELPASPVTYECIGYLEHVSDCAHAGHYTATLYQDDTDTADAVSLAGTSPSRNSKPTTALDSSRSGNHNCGDAAAGTPRGGLWWTLDDSTVSLMTWPTGPVEGSSKCAQDQAPTQSCVAPARIESASAYLLLYRRSDCPRRGGAVLPSEWAQHVAADNAKFDSECKVYENRSSAVGNFLTERRLAVSSLVQSLSDAYAARCLQLEEQRVLAGKSAKQASATGYLDIAKSLSVVPSVWLNSYLHGDDRQVDDLTDPSTTGSKPTAVTYGPTLLRGTGKGRGPVLDPLAVWCGEVKFIPTAALEAFAGRNGMDSSLFLKAENALGKEACEAAFNLARLFDREWRQIKKIVTEVKIPLLDARNMQARGEGKRAVWVSLRVQKLWQSMTRVSSVMNAFLVEAQTARFAGRETSEEEVDEEATQGGGDAAPAEAKAKIGTKPAPQFDPCLLNITEGLLCAHGRVARPRAGCLVRRSELEYLLSLARKKEKAYRRLWPKARTVPRMRADHIDNHLLSIDDICMQCCGDGSNSSVVGPTAQRSLVIKRRYPSGHIRKQGCVSIPEGAEPITGCNLRELVKEQLSLPVAKVFVPGAEAEVELQNNESLGDLVDKVIVEKDEAAQPDREAAAFQGSIFRNTKAGAGAA